MLFLVDLPYESGTVASNLRRKGEALAVSGLTEYGDEIDVIAPADILKQIFKIPYSRARLSIAVHRIGQSLVLNTGYVLSACGRLHLMLYLYLNVLALLINLFTADLMLKREKNWLEDISSHKVQKNHYFGILLCIL